MQWLAGLFATDLWPPRWHCGQWSPALGWTHITADLMTFGAYTAIPIVLGWFAWRRREDVLYPRVLWLFVFFIFFCGTVHLVESLIFWFPMYRLSALVKVGTAIVSWGAVGALIPVAPRLLALRSPLVLERQIAEATATLERTNSELRAVIEEKERAEEQYRAVVECSPTGKVITDAAGKIVLLNAAAEQMFGYRREELLGQSIEVLVPQRLRTSHQAERQVYQSHPRPRAMGAGRELFAKRRDGQEVAVEIALTPLDTAAGPQTLATILDLTARRAAEQSLAASTGELARSNAELEQFAYVASHDLQAPVRQVTSYLELLREQAGDALDENSTHLINQAVAAATRMRTLIQDLLAFSRVGREGESWQSVDLATVVSEITDLLAEDIANTEADVLIGDLPVVEGLPTALRQLFSNLIANALKFSGPERCRVKIDATRQAGRWTVQVSDNGIGMPLEHQDRVFEVFQQLHPRSKYGGNGIGLSICRKIVERHGGQLTVESSPGRGATFAFDLAGPTEQE